MSEREARILSDLSYRGKNIFTLEDIKEYEERPKHLLYSLSKKNWILQIKRGVYIIAPLEAGELGAGGFTTHSFVIASVLVDPYYISHWSALNHHGLTEQTPPAVYVSTTKPRHKKKILGTEFVFVTVAQRKMFGITKITIERKEINISNPEKTIIDCLDHPEHCGGIVEVAKALYFEHRDLEPDKLIQFADKMGNRTILKRLGYLAETLGIKAYCDALAGKEVSKGYSLLDPKIPGRGKINERWKLRANVKVDPEEWTR